MKIKRLFKWFAYVLAALLAVVFLLISFAYSRSTGGCGRMAAPTGETMKAIVYCDYGGPEVLRLETIAKPVPNDNQVLVRIRAAAVNPYDWHFMRGEPFIMRTQSGLRKPKSAQLGVDFSGTIEAIGKNVTLFKPGDAVFGGRTGAFAEYICVSEKSLARKPENMSFEQAGAVQIAGLTALQGLRDKGQLRHGQKVLINGASGGVGTFAVQIAKTLGAHVTGVCSTRNVDLVRSLGADEVIDYRKQDFTKGSERYDVILDMVGNHSLLSCRDVLKPEGRHVIIGGPKGRWLAPMDVVFRAMLLSPFIGQQMGFMISEFKPADLNTLRELMEAGKVTPVIDRRYTLAQVPEAIRYVEEGHARGKVVIAVE